MRLTKASLAGAILSSKRKLIECTCVICGKKCKGRKGRMYCSNACKVAAYKKRIKKLNKLKGKAKCSRKK